MRRPKIAPAGELSVTPTLEDILRFLSRIEEVEGPHWLWKGRVDDNGYGRFDYQGTAVGAHRFSYAVFQGVVPPLKQVHHRDSCRLHSCVYPGCLKPLTRRRNSVEARQHQLSEPGLFHKNRS